MEAENLRPLLNKVGVITGASRGMGRALAEAMAAAGCHLALCARDISPINPVKLGDRFGVPAFAARCDVRHPGSVEEFFAAIKVNFGRIDVLVNNAGVAGPGGPVEQIKFEDWREVVDVNLTGTMLCTRAALPLMDRGATIVNNLSVAARSVFAGQSAYIAAKHGAKGFTDALREEVRERGIRVIGLLPGATNTDIWNQFWPDAPRERMMSPETVARAVLHALTLPQEATVEELVIAPAAGSL